MILYNSICLAISIDSNITTIFGVAAVFLLVSFLIIHAVSRYGKEKLSNNQYFSIIILTILLAFSGFLLLVYPIYNFHQKEKPVEKVVKPKPDEKIVKPKLVEKVVKQKLVEKIVKPKLVEKIVKPKPVAFKEQRIFFNEEMIGAKLIAVYQNIEKEFGLIPVTGTFTIRDIDVTAP